MCPIYEVGEDNGVPFIAMRFLKGAPLHAHWKQNPRLAIDAVVRIGREVAEGLSAAHEAGLIHRDIKPANVWMEAQRNGPPRARILDFGLARGQAEDVQITQSGAILGTPAYMSPEQANGERGAGGRTGPGGPNRAGRGRAPRPGAPPGPGGGGRAGRGGGGGGGVSRPRPACSR